MVRKRSLLLILTITATVARAAEVFFQKKNLLLIRVPCVKLPFARCWWWLGGRTSTPPLVATITSVRSSSKQQKFSFDSWSAGWIDIFSQTSRWRWLAPQTLVSSLTHSPHLCKTQRNIRICESPLLCLHKWLVFKFGFLSSSNVFSSVCDASVSSSPSSWSSPRPPWLSPSCWFGQVLVHCWAGMVWQLGESGILLWHVVASYTTTGWSSDHNF